VRGDYCRCADDCWNKLLADPLSGPLISIE
jgi:hypothetical protein